MPSSWNNRRTFLGALGTTFIGNMIPKPWPLLSSTQSSHALKSAHSLDEKEEYLFEKGLLYFLTAALGPASKKVVDATSAALYELETNPAAKLYGTGEFQSLAEKTRQSAANLMGCDANEMMITRSTTDGMYAIAQGLQLKPGDRVLTTDQEHDGGLLCWEYLRKYHGVLLDIIKIPPGENNPNEFMSRMESAVTKDTRVISVSHILSSTGLRMPVETIAEYARSYNILCIVDGAQSVGNIEVNVKKLGCHAYTTSGHKWLMGPKGTGLLYIADEVTDIIRPIQFENRDKFYTQSTGVGNLPGAIGLGVAIDTVLSKGIGSIESHNMMLRNRIYDGLKSIRKIKIMSAPPGPLASPLVTFELPSTMDSHDFRLKLLNQYHISVKMVPKHWMNGIRISPHIFNTGKEVDKVLDVLQHELT
jgi:selenocysteine lyase/cysteine desulfurase